MHFLTPSECRDWCEASRIPLAAHGIPVRPHEELHHAKVSIPRDFTVLLHFCRTLERALLHRRSCLLWVTESEIWNSGVNWHLYYRLRQSYGDRRLLDEAPGHLFLDYEAPDFVTFLQFAILAGFDAHIINDPTGYSRAFLSHDEFVEFAADDNNAQLVQEFVALTTK